MPPVLVSATLSLLARWSRRPTVQKLQALLNVVAAAGLDEDGIFGPRTDAAVRDFQRSRHLAMDGVVGPLTWAALISEVAGFAPITVRQPQPFDLVDDPVEVCGIGTGFEATFHARVRDANGNQLGRDVHHGGRDRHPRQLPRRAAVGSGSATRTSSSRDRGCACRSRSGSRPPTPSSP